MAYPKIKLSQAFGTDKEGLSQQEHLLLASERRCHILDILESDDQPVAIDDLAVAVATREEDIDPTDAQTLLWIKTNLHHVHLPKMDDYGVVEYDTKNLKVYPNG